MWEVVKTKELNREYFKLRYSRLPARLSLYEPTNHKSVDYRAFKRAFQALRNQSLPLDMALIR